MNLWGGGGGGDLLNADSARVRLPVPKHSDFRRITMFKKRKLVFRVLCSRSSCPGLAEQAAFVFTVWQYRSKVASLGASPDTHTHTHTAISLACTSTETSNYPRRRWDTINISSSADTSSTVQTNPLAASPISHILFSLTLFVFVSTHHPPAMPLYLVSHPPSPLT